MSLFGELRYRFELAKWKRRARRKHKPRIRIGRTASLFAAMDAAEIRYVVLRWFDELPTSDEEAARFDGDLDLLMDHRDLEAFCRVVAAHAGRIPVDLYSDSVRLGTGYKRLPYYPPHLAAQILEARVKDERGFWRPADEVYLLSLAYHLVYHKGIYAGLPTGCVPAAEDSASGTSAYAASASATSAHAASASREAGHLYPAPVASAPAPAASAHEVQGELRQLYVKLGMVPPEEFTLLSLYRLLKERQWDMPYDLLCRWPRRNDWHAYLVELEEEDFGELLGGTRDLLVFLIREDAVEAGLREAVLDKLRSRFEILDTVALSGEQQARVTARTRGGNWIEKKGTLVVKPALAVVCFDPAPQAITDHELAKKHPRVRNQNVFYKHQVRKEIMAEHAGVDYLLHGSDNDFESMEYLIALYGREGAIAFLQSGAGDGAGAEVNQESEPEPEAGKRADEVGHES